jgi:hypothetical protein
VPSTSVRAEGGFDERSLAAIEFGGPILPPEPLTRTQAANIRAYEPPAPDIAEDENAESTAVRGLLALRQQMEQVDDDDSAEDDAWSQALAARMNAARSA